MTALVSPPEHTPADALLVGFTRALRAAGMAVTADRARAYLEAVAAVGLGDRRTTYWAGRATLCAGPEDFAVYDRVFSAWYVEDALASQRSDQRPAPVVSRAPVGDDDGGEAGEADQELVRAAASEAEVLRHRDIATLDPSERARLSALFARLRVVGPTRPSYRRTSARHGGVDPQATLRRTLRRMGEPVEVARRDRSVRPRRTVLLVDVSGSMTAYADALLRLAHRVGQGTPTEVFAVGTRVTRLTRALHHRDAEQALLAAGDTVPDWSGGTRLGEGLKVLLDRWGQRGLVRGAVVVVFSDGWERGDARLLGEQVQRLQRLAHRVVWVNPHKGAAGYQPVQQGIAAALPHVDDFVAGHSVAAFEEVLRVVGRA